MSNDLQKAADFYEDLHWGIEPETVKRAKIPRTPKAVTELGQLESVVYSTDKNGDGFSHYEHAFGEEGGEKPLLAVDPENKKLHVVGGDYTVEDRGIVD